MDYTATPRCSAPRCPRDPDFRFALAFRWESPASALIERAQLRCAEHLSLADVLWLPGLSDGMVVVIDPTGLAGAFGDERSDTVRMESHLIDVDQLRPRRGRPPVPGEPTQLMQAVTGRPLVPGTGR